MLYPIELRAPSDKRLAEYQATQHDTKVPRNVAGKSRKVSGRLPIVKRQVRRSAASDDRFAGAVSATCSPAAEPVSPAASGTERGSSGSVSVNREP
jgi:hypothetical protein